MPDGSQFFPPKPEPFTGLGVKMPTTFPAPGTPAPTFSGVNLAPPKFEGITSGSGTATAAAGKLGALKGMATEFGAAIVAEFLFFLLDKLLGGRLSGSAKKLDTSPQAMQQTAAQQQTTASAVTKQSSVVGDLAKSMMGGVASSVAAASFFNQILKQSDDSKKSAEVQQKTAEKSIEISDIISNAQGVFMMLVKKFGKSVMIKLNSMFGAFLAIVIATLALKIIMMLVMRLIGQVTGKGDQAAATANTALNAITSNPGTTNPTSTTTGGASTTTTTGTANGTTTDTATGTTGGSATGGSTVGQSTTPNVLTGGPGSPGWTPVGAGGAGTVKVTLQDGKVTSVEAPAGRDYRVTVASDADGDGKKETQEVFVDADAAEPPA